MGISNRPQPGNVHTKFQTVMNECRDMVLVFTNAQITELFNNSEPALLDFADKAETNALQTRFFEAMSHIRNKRTETEHVFREQIIDGFENFLRNRPERGFVDREDGVQGEELALVDDAEMDESVAIQNMVSKAFSAYYQPLYALGQRLAVINGGKKVDRSAVPSGPDHLVRSFQIALKDVAVDTKIKLILYALFDKYVLKQARSIYDEFNTNLIDAGILPNLKPVYQRYPGADGAAEPESGYEDQPAEGGTESLGEELFTSILDLMARRRGGAGGKPRPSPANPVPQQTIVSAISALQPTTSTAYTLGQGPDGQLLPDVQIDQEFLARIKVTLDQERNQLFEQVDRNQLATADADTIDLVGMLFEYMLNDPVLPNVAKALISHLHTPYLKVAILDRQLLTDSQHPARQLLDQMVEAGGQWVHENDLKRGIFPAMQSVVDRILKEFTDNLNLFDELLSWFRSKVKDQKRKTDVLEERAKSAAKGREKLHIAKQRAAHEMKARARQSHLPSAVIDFLTKTWADKLIFVLLRHPDGELSEDWKDALRVADELVWAFEPKTSPDENEELIKALPRLRDTIQQELESLGGFHQEHCLELFKLLEDPETVWTSEPSLPVEEDQEVEEIVLESRPIAEPVRSHEKKKGGKGSAGAEVGIEPEPAPSIDDEIGAEEQAMIDRLRNVEFGTWFEFERDDYGGVQRIKLSWLSPLTSTCMFVDRSGVQAAVKTLPELAKELVSGRAKMVEEIRKPFVQRTLETIRNMLTRTTEAPA